MTEVPLKIKKYLLSEGLNPQNQVFACFSCDSVLELENVVGDFVDGRPRFGCPICLEYGTIQKISSEEKLEKFSRRLQK